MRDSSNESDDELEQSRSIIDDTKNVLPSKIKAALVSVSKTAMLGLGRKWRGIGGGWWEASW